MGKLLEITLSLTALAVITHSSVSAATVRTVIPYKSTYSSIQCSEPSATASSFRPADQRVHVYVLVDNVRATDSLVAWFSYSGQQRTSVSFAPVSSDGNWCWSDISMDISQFTSSSFGSWTFQVFANGQALTPIGTFTIDADVIQPRGPEPDGYFDLIASDCSHFGGWALYKNDPTTISVEVAVDGFARRTVQAGDFRSDVGSHGWNLYNLQQYEDGQTHIVHVFYSGTALELPGSPRQFPPQGAVTSSCGGISPRGGPGVSWVSKPPDPFQNGATLNASWQIAGGSQAAFSHIHIDTDSARVLTGNRKCVAAPDQGGGDGNYSQTFTPTDSGCLGTLSAGTTIYFAVHASGNVDYYSLPAQSTVGALNPPPPIARNLWIFSADSRALRTQVDSRLTDFIVVIEKTRVTNSIPKFRYAISVLGDNFHELQTALLTMVVGKDVDIDINSPTAYRLINIPGGGVFQNILANTDSGWEDLSVQQPITDFGSGLAQVMKDAIGFIPYVGTGQAVIDGFGDLAALFKDSPTVPSSDFSNKAREINQNHKINLVATKLRPPFWVSGSLVYAVRFTVIVDESNGRPSFFLRARNSQDKIVGVEFGNLQ